MNRGSDEGALGGPKEAVSAERDNAPWSIKFLCLLALAGAVAIVISSLLFAGCSASSEQYQNELTMRRENHPSRMENCGEVNNRPARIRCEERNRIRLGTR